MGDSNLHDHSHAPAPRDPNILPTDEEREAEEARQRESADKEADTSYKERQISAAEAANDLARSNRTLMFWVAILSAVTAGATLYQGWMNHKSWQTAQNTLAQMQRDSKASGDQFQAQLSHFDDGLGRTGLLAVHAGEQARADKDSADAAKSAADTAKEALHISQRAFIVTVAPVPDFDSGSFILRFENVGHIPSGQINLRVFEATFHNISPGSKDMVIVEKHWNTHLLPATPTGVLTTYQVLTDSLIALEFNAGNQSVQIGGILFYNDGFKDTPIRAERFCFESHYDLKAKVTRMINCDPLADLDALINKAVQYPKNEQDSSKR